MLCKIHLALADVEPLVCLIENRVMRLTGWAGKIQVKFVRKKKDCLSFGFVWFELCIGNIWIEITHFLLRFCHLLYAS